MSRSDFVRVATLSELETRGAVTVRAGRQRIAVFADGADVWAQPGGRRRAPTGTTR